MTVPAALLGFASVAAVITLVPGLDTTLVLRSTLSRSRTHGFLTAAGIQVGLLVWGVASALGVTMLLAGSDRVLRVLALLGAAYLLWMGAGMIRTGFRPLAEVPAGGEEDRQGWGRSFGTGVATNLLNPKIGVFYLAVIPQFLPEAVSPVLMGTLLALVHIVLGTTWLSLVVLAAGLLAGVLATPVARRWIDRVAGTMIVLFALGLLVTHLSD